MQRGFGVGTVSVFVATLCASPGERLAAQGASEWVEYFEIARSGDPLPGGGGVFEFFGNSEIEGPRVLVCSSRDQPSFCDGVYLYTLAADGSASGQKVVDTTTPVPGDAGAQFARIASPDLLGGSIVFRGVRAGGAEGIYIVHLDGAGLSGLARVADDMTAIPGGTGNFMFFNDPKLFDDPTTAGADVAFLGGNDPDAPEGRGLERICIWRAATTATSLLAERDTPLASAGNTQPGGFTSFGPPSYEDGVFVFFARRAGGVIGIYRMEEGAAAEAIVETGTAVLGGGATFTGFGTGPTIRDGVFHYSGRWAAAAGQIAGQAIFAFDGEEHRVIVDTRTLLPGESSATFSALSDASVDARELVFQGVGTRRPIDRGLYAHRASALDKIVDDQDADALAGEATSLVPFRFSCGTHCESRSRVAFRVCWTTATAPAESLQCFDPNDRTGVLTQSIHVAKVRPFRPRRTGCGDVNGDGKIDISDPVALLTFLFLGGPPPEMPFVWGP